MPRPLLAAIATLLLAAPASTASATPPDVFGYGPRTQGMGMTGASHAHDYEAVYSNPAGLAAARRYGLHFGLQAASFHLKLDGQNSPLDSYQGQTIGLQLPIPFGGKLEDVFVFGAGFYTPSGTVLQTDIIFAEVPQWAVLNRTQSVHLQLGLGINLERLVPGLRFGFGVAALANIGGRLDVLVDEANQFVSQTETQLLASYNPIIGVQYDVSDFSIGLVWHDRVQSDIDLNVVVSNLGVELPVITITAIPQYDPHAFVGELSWHPGDHVLVAAQLVYRRWSQYEGTVGKSSEFSNLPPSPAFRDTYSPRVGFEYRATRRRTTGALRLGYSYEMTPAPRAALRPGRDSEGVERTEPDRVTGEAVLQPVRYLDSDRHIVTLGAGVTWESAVGAVLRLELFTQLHRVVERTHNIPAPGATANMVTEGWIFASGWSASLEW